MKNVENIYPLSPMQQGMLFHTLYAQDSDVYRVQVIVTMRGLLNVSALKQAWKFVVERHAVLRTGLMWENLDEPLQIVRKQVEVPWEEADWRGLAQLDQEARVADFLRADRHRSLPLSNAPVMRLSLFHLADELTKLIWSTHHILMDGWSISLLFKEVFIVYEAINDGREPQLEPARPFSDYIAWLQQQDLSAAEAFWRETLKGVTAPTEVRVERSNAVGRSEHRQQRLKLSRELTAEIQNFTRTQRLTPNTLMQGAWALLLARYSGARDVVFGAVISGRPAELGGFESMIGPLINTLPVRVRISEDDAVVPWLQKLQHQQVEQRQYEYSPLVSVQDWTEVPRGTPLFESLLAFENYPARSSWEEGSPSLKFDLAGGIEVTDYPIAVTVNPRDEWEFKIGYDRANFEESTIARMLGHLATLIQGLIGNPNKLLLELPMMTGDEQREIISGFNQTERKYLEEKCVHHLFEEQAERTPERIAVAFENEQLNYAELNRRANQLAHYLLSRGVEPEVRVGVCMERSLELVVTLLGILKAGGAYVPLDPDYPADRLSYMLKDANVGVLVIQKRFKEMVTDQVAELIEIEKDGAVFAQENALNPETITALDNLAYVIYTSGSTGRPKGAMNTHRGLCNRLLWMQEAYQLGQADRVLQKTPFSFDVSVWEFFWPLITGARLVMASPSGHRDTSYLVKTIQKQQITTLHFVPSMLKVFLEQQGVSQCESIRQVISSGEALSLELQQQFQNVLQAKLHNLYGPTEASIDVTFWECRDEKQRTVPIGRPIANTQIYILGEYLQPVPVGVAGELFIGGTGLGRGYLARPDLTADKFIPSPFAAQSGDRLYKTGDLARFRFDGSIEYLGRADHQVKIRGFRIELGEIEANIAEHEGVRESIVVTREDHSGAKQIVAYVVPDHDCAFTVWRQLQLEKLGLLEQPLRLLPNGMPIIYRNNSEMDFVYHEIFEEQSYFKHGITLEDGCCVFDVGANIGLFTLFVHQQCKGAQVYAFEPIPPLFETLKLNASLYNFEAKTFSCGLSAQRGSADFVYYPHASVMSGRFADQTEERDTVKSYLLNQQAENGVNDLSPHELEALLDDRLSSEKFVSELRTLSDIIQEFEVRKIDLLKIDVEKAELDVLEGLRRVDWPKIKQVVVEVHDIDGRLARVTDLLKEYGFSVTVEQDSLLKNTKLYNLYAVRAGKAEPELVCASRKVESPRVWLSARELIGDLKDSLKRALPDYMVPSAFVLLESLPLTPNGKVDRKALPAPGSDTPEAKTDYVAPRTPLERSVAAVWSRILAVADVGIHDNFLELGGHSLLAMQVVSGIQNELRVELPLRWIFESPTVARLAARLEAASDQFTQQETPRIQRVARDQALPLSFAQQQLWFFAQLAPGNLAYNQPRGFRLKGTLDIAALLKSFNSIVARHEILRTTFAAENGKPIQIIAESAFAYMSVVDLTSLPEIQRETKAQLIATEGWQQPFDLSRGPLLRVSLIRLSSEEHILLSTTHHTINDGWSMGILFRELGVFYDAFSAGNQASLPELAVQYADYAWWQQQQFLRARAWAESLGYWRQQLKGVPEVTQLPADFPRPAVRGFLGAREQLTFSEETSNALKAVAGSGQATLYMILLSAFQSLLWFYSGDEDVVVGSPGAGRSHPETEALIGHFVNTLVLRANLSGDPEFREVLERVRNVTLEALAHQDVPFERLVEELQPRRTLSYNPLFQVWFVLLDTDLDSLELRGLKAEFLDIENCYARHDLQLTVWETSDGLRGSLNYNTDLFTAITAARIAQQFQTLVGLVVTSPQIRLSELRRRLEEDDKENRAELAKSLKQAGQQKLRTTRRKSVPAPPNTTGELQSTPNP